MKGNTLSRRRFIRTSAATAGLFYIVPSHAVSGLGHVAPSDKLNIAGIGVGVPDGVEMGEGMNGVIFHGSKGILICGNYGAKYRLLPEEKFKNLPNPAARLRRVGMSHEMDFVRACKEPAGSRVLPLSNFEYAGPLNEMVVMGNLAVRMKSLNKKLQWDGENMRITNLSDSDTLKVPNGVPGQEPKVLTLNAIQAAEEYVRHTYHNGWSLNV